MSNVNAEQFEGFSENHYQHGMHTLAWISLWTIIVLGVGATFALAKVLKGLVYGMEGLTAPPLLLAAGVVALAATFAILIPAWRASKLDPLVALRID